ncbi:PREDICTED: dnaJ homolog subfamily C member 17 [Nicrophorus vespilloides]|uniref:DnaJ homolog subfamily C member 17 n=1 Tax=Nicrophorus vespilloides TaxID=110193 RepID=A0ABM1MAS9_NICVS|nr:PREDICTED: dnaJ homolog subfamily C member 17 [Nicrophorus vespilloides]
MDFKIENEDLYELLGIEIESSTNDIKKAYRKKALNCHPDKNPDNPNAAAEFHRLTKILEVLTDETARKAYDRVLKGKKEAALRHKQLDSKRQKLKEDLEARERVVSKGVQKSDADKLKEEIERLRKEGSKLVQDEMESVMSEIRSQANKVQEDTWDSAKNRIKIKWKANKNDPNNGGYNQELLQRFLSKYGDIVVMVMSPKKTGSALVEFATKRAAEMAVQIEKGLADNPLELTWVNGPPASVNRQSTTIKDSDFESIVLTKMRQAEERKRLIEQMIAEDN